MDEKILKGENKGVFDKRAHHWKFEKLVGLLKCVWYHKFYTTYHVAYIKDHLIY